MERMDEIDAFLSWAVIESIKPTALLALCKLLGFFPLPWKWVILPFVSAYYFFVSFLMATALIGLAHAMANRS